MRQPHNTLVGNLIPTIMGIKSKLDQTIEKAIKPLVNALSDTDSRVAAVLSDKEHLIASEPHLQFKLNFLTEDSCLNIKRMLSAYIQEVAAECLDHECRVSDDECSLPTSATTMKEVEDDLYSFIDTDTTSTTLEQCTDARIFNCFSRADLCMGE